MKSIFSILTLALLLSACGDQNKQSVTELLANGDMKAIRTKKNEISAQQRELENKMALIDSFIHANDDNKKVPLVTTFPVKREIFDHYIELQGNVKTKQNVLIYPEVAGTLVSVKVSEGQKVSKGQLLAVVDNGGMNSQLKQLKTQRDLAKTTYERQENLWKQKIGSEMQYLQAKASFEAQDDAVKQMVTRLDKYNIRAPFSGVIDDVIKDQGSVIAPGLGSEIFRIVNLSKMFVEVLVPEAYIASITKGKSVKVEFPILGKTINSKVLQTGSFIDPNNRSFKVGIPVTNARGKVKPNMVAKVQINDYRNEKAILVPQSIISENAKGQQYTFVVSKPNAENIAKATKSIITTGKTQGDIVEVTSGIEEGQSVIEEGARSVKDGQEVKILKK